MQDQESDQISCIGRQILGMGPPGSPRLVLGLGKHIFLGVEKPTGRSEPSSPNGAAAF